MHASQLSLLGFAPRRTLIACFAGPTREVEIEASSLKIVLDSSLTHVSLQSSSNRKHDSSASRARIERTRLVPRNQDKNQSSSLREQPPGPTSAIAADPTQPSNQPSSIHRRNVTKLARKPKIFLCLVQVLFTASTEPKTITQPTKAVTLALTSSQLSKLEPLIAWSLLSQPSLSKSETELR
jgi:hypothetical protein